MSRLTRSGQGWLALATGVLLVLLCAWIYTPGTSGPPLLDDVSSVGVLNSISENPEYARDFVFRDTSGPLGRTVSIATFALEEVLLDGEVATRKATNIGLHLLVGGMIAWLFILLLTFYPVPGGKVAGVLAAGIWMLTPLYVSTVLYVVQRMAMLAALFSVATLLAYLHWRIGLLNNRNRKFLLALSFVFFVLAVFAKENALVILPILLILETFWCQFRGSAGPIPVLRRIVLALIALGSVAALVLLLGGWEHMAAKFGNRDFTMEERLLSESRIVLDYAVQFFFPDVQRMGVYHDDFPVSRSHTQPYTTGYALAAWIALGLSVAVMSLRSWGRVVSFGILFFVIGHSIESSVWPLELYFEHRNYLPGIGLALLPLTLYVLAVRRWPEVHKPLLAWMAVWLIWLATLTSSQVQIWSNSSLLAIQHVNAHPGSARANNEYATVLANVGALEMALEYSTRAHKASLLHLAAADESEGDYQARNIALSCLARKPLPGEMLSRIGAANPGRPMGSVATMSVIVRLRQENICPQFDWDALSDHLAGLYLTSFDAGQASANMFSVLASLANAQGRFEEAYQYTRRHLHLAPGSVTGLLMQLHFTTVLGLDEEAGTLKNQLLSLAESGKLTRLERDNLSLYLES